MERLTTNKPVKEMGMYELAHNSCYIDKYGYTRYRDFETDIDIRKMTRDIMQSFEIWKIDDDEMLSDETFDNTIIDYLMYGEKEYEGLVALFYRNLWAMADLRERLKCYEDLEEQGLLLKLPCKIGDDVYIIPSKVNYDLNVLNKHEENNRVYHQKILRITITEKGWHVETDKDYEYGTGRVLTDTFFKETWFLTKAEAQQALEKMKGEET